MFTAIFRGFSMRLDLKNKLWTRLIALLLYMPSVHYKKMFLQWNDTVATNVSQDQGILYWIELFFSINTQLNLILNFNRTFTYKKQKNRNEANKIRKGPHGDHRHQLLVTGLICS